jgi:L-lactate dehydrogenase (cytochrome)
MVDASVPGQVQFLQLYVNSDRARTKKIIAHAKERGVKALFITVDAPQLGRREKVSSWPLHAIIRRPR